MQKERALRTALRTAARAYSRRVVAGEWVARRALGLDSTAKPLLHDPCWPGYTKTVELGLLPILANGTWDSWGSISSPLKRRSLSASLSWAE